MSKEVAAGGRRSGERVGTYSASNTHEGKALPLGHLEPAVQEEGTTDCAGFRAGVGGSQRSDILRGQSLRLKQRGPLGIDGIGNARKFADQISTFQLIRALALGCEQHAKDTSGEGR